MADKVWGDKREPAHICHADPTDNHLGTYADHTDRTKSENSVLTNPGTRMITRPQPIDHYC